MLCRNMFIVWLFMLLHFSLQSAAQPPEENSTRGPHKGIPTEMGISTKLYEYDDYSKHLDGNLTYEYPDTDDETQIPISSWISWDKWIVNCLTEYQNTIPKDNFFQDRDSIEINRPQPETSAFLLMGSGQVHELLEAIRSYKHTTQIFFDMYEKAIEYIDFNTNTSNVNDCYNYQSFKFIQNQAKYLDIMYECTWWVYVFQMYIEIPIVLTVFLSGLLMTGTLLYIFLKHKELRSEQNMIVFNIAICDFLSLIIVYPTQYFIYNGIFISVYIIESYRIILIALTSGTALSILALGIQRLFAVTECLRDSCCGRLSKLSKVCLFVSSVWGPTVAFIILNFTGFSDENVGDLLATFMAITATFFTISLPIAITAINCTVAIKLKRSAKQMPGENTHQIQMEARYRSSKVINFLCFVFWITHGPFLIAQIYLFSEIVSNDVISLKYKYVSCAFHGLYCSSAFFNPLALAIMSKKFKILFKRYLCRKLSGKTVKLCVDKAI